MCAKERFNLFDGITLGIHLMLGQTQINQDQQFDIQFIECLPAAVRHLRNNGLTLITKLSYEVFDSLTNSYSDYRGIRQVLPSDVMEQACRKIHDLMIVGKTNVSNLQSVANGFCLFVGGQNIIDVRRMQLITRNQKEANSERQEVKGHPFLCQTSYLRKYIHIHTIFISQKGSLVPSWDPFVTEL